MFQVFYLYVAKVDQMLHIHICCKLFDEILYNIFLVVYVYSLYKIHKQGANKKM